MGFASQGSECADVKRKKGLLEGEGVVFEGDQVDTYGCRMLGAGCWVLLPGGAGCWVLGACEAVDPSSSQAACA